MPCSVGVGYQRFRAPWCLHIFALDMEAESALKRMATWRRNPQDLDLSLDRCGNLKSRIFLNKLTVAKLINELLISYGTRSFITVFTRARSVIVSRPSWGQRTPFTSSFFRILFNIILSYALVCKCFILFMFSE